MITLKQIKKIAAIIKDNVSWFMWRVFGDRVVSKKDVEKSEYLGSLPLDDSLDALENSYVLGRKESMSTKDEFKDLEFEELEEENIYVDDHKFHIDAAETSTKLTFDRLNDDIKDTIFKNVQKATKTAISEIWAKGVIKDKVESGVIFSKSYTKVANEIRKELGIKKYNWERVAITEMHTIRQKGIATAIINKDDIYKFSEGIDSNVAVLHAANQCDVCKRLYYDGLKPKIFKLRELVANEGSNFIAPWRENAKPVVPPLHPNCTGYLVYVPEDWGFDEDGKMFFKE